MSISNYSQLQEAVAAWLNRADLEQQIPEFIRLAEVTLTKVARSSHLVTHGSLEMTGGQRYLDAPAELIEPIFASTTATDETLEQVSIQQLNWLRKRMRSAGTPRFYAIVGRRIELVPTPEDDGDLLLAYYRTVPTLSTGSPTNDLLTYEPDLYLYTSLLHAAPFLKDDAKTQLFGTLVAQQVAAAVQQQKTVQFDSKMAGPSLNAPADVR